jgi:chromosome segregation ATPase
LEQQAAPIKTKHEANLAQWKDLGVTSQQVFFTEGMTTEELASVNLLAKLNGALLEEQLQLSTFASAIDAERSASQEHERSPEASRDSFQSLDMRVKTLEAELRVAETNWVKDHFKDQDRVAHLEEAIAKKHQASKSQSQNLDSFRTKNELLTKANQAHSQKIDCLQKDNEFLKNQVRIIEMENMVTDYGCALRQASNILDEMRADGHGMRNSTDFRQTSFGLCS